MVCIYCGGKTRVSNSRPLVRSNQIWRRRTCKTCGAVFTTIEENDARQTWVVKSSDRPPVGFVREKLFLSIYESLRHRPTALYDAKHLTQTIINNLGRTTKNGIIEASTIKNMVVVSLNRFDRVASTHYKAFHAV
jgi:transcriptional regulator NrdR family protein